MAAPDFQANPMLLRLRHIAFSHGPHPVFRNLSLELPAGRALALAGSNGAGKTTLLKLMAGLLPPGQGRVERNFSRGAFLGHQTMLYPRLTVLENLRFWSALSGGRLDKAALLAALGRAGLAHLAREKAGDLSRGTAQLVSIIRVFAPGPDCIFLDEPATGLDGRGRSVLAGLMFEAGKRGAGIVWSGHAPLEASFPADAVLELRQGRLAPASGSALRRESAGGQP